LPKSKFDDVFEPVEALPIDPINVPKHGYSVPMRAKARPSTPSSPQYLVKKLRLISVAIGMMVSAFQSVLPSTSTTSLSFMPMTAADRNTAANMPAPVAGSPHKTNIAVSA
jgi:hypothetical protein